MSDEDLFLAAHKELENHNQQESLWIKALTLSEGDAEKARHQYIILRVEQLKNESCVTSSDDSGRSIYRSLYFFSIVIGISIAFYIYLVDFDSFSETTLVRITPIWFFPIVFGYYGFVSQRMAKKLGKSHFENVADLLLSIIQGSTGNVGKAASLLVHAPFIIIKSKKPFLVALGGSLIWAVLLVIFFEAIFPSL